jgi:hypothetical protein
MDQTGNEEVERKISHGRSRSRWEDKLKGILKAWNGMV